MTAGAHGSRCGWCAPSSLFCSLLCVSPVSELERCALLTDSVSVDVGALCVQCNNTRRCACIVYMRMRMRMPAGGRRNWIVVVVPVSYVDGNAAVT